LPGNTASKSRQHFHCQIGNTADQRHKYQKENPIATAAGLEYMNDQDQLNEPDNNRAYTHVTAVSVTEFMQNDILPGSLQQPQKAFEDFWGYPLFRSNR
jgi:hypothetical protein